MNQDLFIIGATGNVGRELIRQVNAKDIDPTVHSNPSRIVGVASSKLYLYDPQGLGERAAQFANRQIDAPTYVALPQVLGNVSTGKHENLIFVDVTAGGQPVSQFHSFVMENFPYSIVTANKKPLADGTVDEFEALVRNVPRYGYRSSVMAGADVVTKLRNLRDLRDPITSIEGCFSGTLGYLSTALQNGEAFSSALAYAREQGYTEPNPMDDLGGTDVARKLVILARTSGIPLSLDDIALKPFIPAEYVNAEYWDSPSQHTFALNERGADKYFQDKMVRANAQGNTLRYVARIAQEGGNFVATCQLDEVDPNISPLATLKGTANMVSIVSEIYGPQSPYVVRSPGAGREVTAANVRNDVIDLLRNRMLVSSPYLST